MEHGEVNVLLIGESERGCWQLASRLDGEDAVGGSLLRSRRFSPSSISMRFAWS
jgi:hypothetical protein